MRYEHDRRDPRRSVACEDAAALNFELSPTQRHWRDRVRRFIDAHVHPVAAEVRAEAMAPGPERWRPAPQVEASKARGRAEGLWNLFLPSSPAHDVDDCRGAGSSDLDDAIQAHGGAGVSEDFGLAQSYASIRTLRLADGPDEVHDRAIARLERDRHTHPPRAS